MIFNKDIEVIETFHSGGMGIVHRGFHKLWNTEVIVKHPRKELMIRSDQIEEFHAECHIWSSIGLHPYIATCFYSSQDGSVPYVVAEYVTQGSLHDMIRSRQLYQNEEDIALSKMLVVAASSARGLQSAHDFRLLHCDVKPSNILLTECGYAKIADFGLAVAFGNNNDLAKAKGLTLPFASPEQIRGASLSSSTDIWSWAASMLAMFMGEVTWESGSACGAVLSDYINGGSKAYRIPQIPQAFAKLLEDCLRFSERERISSFDHIANTIDSIYQDIFREPCPAVVPDLELVSADSLNNRAVSRYAIQDKDEAKRLLSEALKVDELHPEANFNSAVLYFENHKFADIHMDRLRRVTQFDIGEYRPWLFLACLLNSSGLHEEAAECYMKAKEIASVDESEKINILWQSSKCNDLHLVLAPSVSGEDFAYDSMRFNRLMEKAEIALHKNFVADAHRYILMSGDIPGFARHPRRRRLIQKLS